MRKLDDMLFDERVNPRKEEREYSLNETPYEGLDEVKIQSFKGGTSIRYWM